MDICLRVDVFQKSPPLMASPMLRNCPILLTYLIQIRLEVSFFKNHHSQQQQDKIVLQLTIVRGCSDGNQIIKFAKLITHLRIIHIGLKVFFLNCLYSICKTKLFCYQILSEDALSENMLMNWPKILSFLISIHLWLKVLQKMPHIVLVRLNCFTIEHCMRMLCWKLNY